MRSSSGVYKMRLFVFLRAPAGLMFLTELFDSPFFVARPLRFSLVGVMHVQHLFLFLMQKGVMFQGRFRIVGDAPAKKLIAAFSELKVCLLSLSSIHMYLVCF